MVIQENKAFIFTYPRRISCLKYAEHIALSKLMGGLYKLLMNACARKANKDKKYKVSICGIFRDEALYMKEWIEFHKLAGVDHFYLYNNFSKDDYLEVLVPYIENGDVTLTDWPIQYGQIAAYRDCIKKYRNETQWIGFIDLDEFVVPKAMDSIYDFLKPFSRRSAVLIPWKMFGSSGYMKRDTGRLVTEDFTVCWPKYCELGKCFYNTNFDFAAQSKHNGALMHLFYGSIKGIALPPVNIFDQPVVMDVYQVPIEDFPIQINHYHTKSWEEYKAKLRRKSAYSPDDVYEEQTFFEREMKCTDSDHSAYKFLIKLKLKLRTQG